MKRLNVKWNWYVNHWVSWKHLKLPFSDPDLYCIVFKYSMLSGQRYLMFSKIIIQFEGQRGDNGDFTEFCSERLPIS